MLCAASLSLARAVLMSFCASAARARSSRASPCCSASSPGIASALSRSSAALPGSLAAIQRLPAAAHIRAVAGSLSDEALAASSKDCAAPALSPLFCSSSAWQTSASGVTTSGQADALGGAAAASAVAAKRMIKLSLQKPSDGAQDRVDLMRFGQAMPAAFEHQQLDIG